MVPRDRRYGWQKRRWHLEVTGPMPNRKLVCFCLDSGFKKKKFNIKSFKEACLHLGSVFQFIQHAELL